jgi:hypothetical protein
MRWGQQDRSKTSSNNERWKGMGRRMVAGVHWRQCLWHPRWHRGPKEGRKMHVHLASLFNNGSHKSNML